MKTGDRVRMIHMPADPDPIPTGTEGTVEDVQKLNLGARSFTQIFVRWDNGRSLSCIAPPDRLAVITPETVA